tara:strand:- start:8103 stop:8435 length:333 start_codon:yes stop_codon:yes gene_type:complete
MTEQDIEEGKGLAIISYLTIIGTIIAFFMNNDKKNAFTAFHIRQALGLWLTYFIVAWVVSGFDNWFATLGFWLFFGILFIYGFINAVAGRAQEVPVLGNLFQKWFASIGK